MGFGSVSKRPGSATLDSTGIAPDPDLDPDPDPNGANILDPDADPNSMYLDPQHWFVLKLIKC